MRNLRCCVLLLSSVLGLCVASALAQKTAAKKPAAGKAAAPKITMTVDLTDAPRKIFHAHLTIPATPGTLTLYYPKWIPGEHSPNGPIQNLTGLMFKANGETLKWRRDLLDGWKFHVEVPAGVSSVEASLDFDSPTSGPVRDGIYTGGQTATDKLALLSWNTVVLYPAGWPAADLSYEASLRLPADWKFSTALPIASQSGSVVQFQPAPLNTLIDSPVLSGEFMRIVPLAENPHEELDLAADSAAALDVPQNVLALYPNLTDQARKLFGTQHFRDYHFLYTLSDHVAHFGIEHHESNDSRMYEAGMVDPDVRLVAAGLLPHEYVHSWNGKYRRPADLATPDYEQPMQDDLLWVYEGLTSYLGDVLSARSGLRTPEQYRDNLALIAARLDHVPGRTWRNLQDTADGMPVMIGAPLAWQSWRRTVDYYEEDVLNWLAVDNIIRQQTHGAKSIDDFCLLFHGGQGGQPVVNPYTFDDVVNTLNQIAPYGWRRFWTERLTNHGPGAPLDGIAASGWKLVYDDTRSEILKKRDAVLENITATYSIGLLLKKDGMIVDTIEGMAAAKAGIGPGMKLIAVNGRKFSGEVLRDALKEGKVSSTPLELLVENTDYYNTYKLDYHDGEMYPHLVRDESKPDVLAEIIKAK